MLEEREGSEVLVVRAFKDFKAGEQARAFGPRLTCPPDEQNAAGCRGTAILLETGRRIHAPEGRKVGQRSRYNRMKVDGTNPPCWF